MFVAEGLDALRNAPPKVPVAEDVAPPVAARIPGLPADDTELLIKVNGGAQVVAGSLLTLGRLPRLSALVLAASLVPTTAAGHRFWEEDEPGRRAEQQVHFLKNVSMLGGLLLAAADTAGRPSLGWRARRAARDVERAGRRQKHDVERRARRARREAKLVAQEARMAAKAGAKAGRRAG